MSVFFLIPQTTHRYGPNTFKLHRLPMPRPGQVLGLVGTNGIGKSTALKILAGKMKPNLGRFNDNAPDWQEILTYFRGSELQNYFTRILEDNLIATIKYVHYRLYMTSHSRSSKTFSNMKNFDHFLFSSYRRPQYVDNIPKAVRGNVGTVLKQKMDPAKDGDALVKLLDLEQVRIYKIYVRFFILFVFISRLLIKILYDSAYQSPCFISPQK